MEMTFFIMIDETPIPVLAEEGVIPVDCRQVNLLCSYLGDALTGNLSDENGQPYYLLLSPVGRLLKDYAEANTQSFNGIMHNLLDITKRLLHKNIESQNLTVPFTLPDDYIFWLTMHDNKYLRDIGDNLSHKKGRILLDLEDLMQDLTTSIQHQISHAIAENPDVKQLVFSSSSIDNHSSIVKSLTLGDVKLISFPKWFSKYDKLRRAIEAMEVLHKPQSN